MAETAIRSTVLDQGVGEVWALIRDFDSYAAWVAGVGATPIEGGAAGTTVGAVRQVNPDGILRRQRLVAHSDLDHCFSYQGCEPLILDDGDRFRTMHSYVGTVAVQPITDGDRSLVCWSALYRCPGSDSDFWATWWQHSLDTWLLSLRAALEERRHIHQRG